MPGFVRNPRLPEVRGADRAGATSRSSVADPELRARLTPSYSFGCKRVLPSNDWYPAITQPNVDVVTEGIAEVRPQRRS